MKHAGRSTQAGLRLILWTFVLLVAITAGSLFAMVLGSLLASVAIFLLSVWVIFAAFTLYFFRDPEPRVPSDPDIIVAPAHGKVDLIDETTEEHFMGGPCKRVSIFLSVFDVHVQNAPVAGSIALSKYTEGKFLNAIKSESAQHNENALIGIESNERAGERIAVRLIAGLIARRIVPYISVGEQVSRGERISLIQFGSRCDLYLPLSAQVRIKLGTHVKGGETIIASRG